jgi:cyclohexanecarboxyl-CoA dehydrogenase
VDFDLLPEHRDLLAVAGSIADGLAPGYVARDRAAEIPWTILKQLGNAGLLGLQLPESAGGQGAGAVAAGLVSERLTRGDLFAGSMVITAGTTLTLLHRFAAPGLAARWIPPVLAGETIIALGLTEPQSGSDLKNVTTTAKRQGSSWIIRGEKSSVTYADGRGLIVLAATEEGPQLFFIEDRAGVYVQYLDDLGFCSSRRAVLTFDDVRVEDHGRLRAESGLKTIFAALVSARLMACMSALGLGRAALDDAVAWAKDRVTFGAPLSTRQGVSFPLVQYWTELEMGRALTLRGLWLADQGRPHDVEAAMAKSWIPARVVELCHQALLVNGHVGYSREHPSQLRLRDAIGIEIGEGPANIQNIILSRQLFGGR